MDSKQSLYERYRQQMRKIADIKYASAVLQWDQETYLPANSAELRGQQLATLSEVAHSMFTDEQVGRLLNELNEAELPTAQARNVQLTLEDYQKQKRFSPAFVRTMSETVSASFHAWLDARKKNDFKVFEPALAKLVDLKKQEAELLGFEEHPYDALMNDFEKGATVAELDKVFDDVKLPLKQLLDEINSLPEPDDSFLHQHFPKQQQWEWGMYLAGQLNFDFKSGRQDISEHPFTINFSSNDVRITTRIDEQDFSNMTWSTIHEVGHALYEQGLPNEMYGLPLGEYASLGIHESQSRLWENCVGRGVDFWQYYLPVLQSRFPQQLGAVELPQFVAAINKVKPSLIRTEADELTYHFHVMIRYELEKLLIEGSLSVSDIPAYWNEQYEKLLGVKVTSDLAGCLQDVHWSHGSFGYFATYSLGSFYAAQLWQQANIDLPQLQHEIVTTGSTMSLLNWLRDKIHQHGRAYTSAELCTMVTGKPLDSRVFMDYLRNKLVQVYGR
jgi:carboxypeptidase Taq